MEEIQPENQPEEVKWNGWGYSDTRFVVNKDGVVELTGIVALFSFFKKKNFFFKKKCCFFKIGARYLFSGKTFPELRKWAEETAGLDIDKETPPQVLFFFKKIC